jgi:hypothetical protein
MTGSEAQGSRRSRWLAPAVGAALLTFLIWASSPLLFGQLEPWDTPYPIYTIAVFLGGVIFGYRYGGAAILSCPLGAWAGQIVALLVLPGLDRTWFLLGVFTTGLGSLLALAGAALGTLVHGRADV